uniref:Tyrosine--tRNA ligase n=1 Tax=Methanocaldococcus jannaschii (strain ATCC 43067 / DSM 2661 / JAL-1 / JCM 10045 / NBRC 100440) TaxID=243232 RepID=UPI001ABD4856|nr:Chain A, Tyrosine--tRNA ligase [Methanocaldococcus jannaschii DSM 2661]7CKG_B Chain B, Tyrosine--tRNA ligase [Methanocaldococcus jannaschii DSM 2661]7CKH_A Chain A, Tyrosine--tRNA ligase [Methanocaldococcus jannaschii DSM 2661]7CKH_B Chain B, Tyrosine--tRNA ligase [Methanocaldococcus jannaschii DSM 2661]
MDEFEMIKRNTSEIISEEELREVLKKDEKSAHIGFEPSGKIHLGHYLQIKKMIDLQNAGFDIGIVLADLQAYLNQKGELDEIRKIGDYNKKVFEAMGLKAKYVYGSEFQLDKDYTLNVYRLALKTTLKRARRSMELIAREDENPKVAEVIYPIMQVNGGHYLGGDVAVGGMEQRKIHMLARELLPKKVVCIHNPVLTGLDGEGKMSSSKGNFIAVDDSPEEIRAKIKKAYCPAGVVEGNPIMEIAKYFLEYPLTIKRPEKFGGDLTVNSYEELESLFKNKELHPMDLKNAVAEELIKILEPIRKRLLEHHHHHH